MGCSSGSNARYFTNVLVGLRAPSEALTPCELVNSVMIRPQPSRLRMKRRNTVSVTPAMGARTVAGAIFTVPIAKLVGNSGIKTGLLKLPLKLDYLSLTVNAGKRNWRALRQSSLRNYACGR